MYWTRVGAARSFALNALPSPVLTEVLLLFPQFQLFLGALCIGFAPVYVKLIAMGPITIAFYRCLFGFLILAPFIFKFWRPPTPGTSTLTNRKFWLLIVLAGLVFAADLAVWHQSVVFVGAGMSTMLANCQVLYLAAYGVLFAGERFSWRFLLALPLAIAGIFMLVKFADADLTAANGYWFGVFLGLVTGAIYALFIVCVRSAERFRAGLDALPRTALVSGFGAAFLLPMAAFWEEVPLPVGRDLYLVILLALIAQVVGWYLLTKNLTKVPVSRAGLIILAQPLFATLFGAIAFNEQLNLTQLLGGALVLAAIYLGVTRQEA